jgi:hypothetical protein
MKAADKLPASLDFAERALERARQREEDARALAAGEKSRQALQAENGAFAFPRSRIRLDLSRTKHY